MGIEPAELPDDDWATEHAWTGTARYDVLRVIGRGGMGVVYEAFDRARHQRVALKKLLRFSPVALYQFKQEFRALADVEHPNLVRLYELVALDAARPFFAMELVRGEDFLGHVWGGHDRSPQRAPRTPNMVADREFQGFASLARRDDAAYSCRQGGATTRGEAKPRKFDGSQRDRCSRCEAARACGVAGRGCVYSSPPRISATRVSGTARSSS
jgi:hypothetical protein